MGTRLPLDREALNRGEPERYSGTVHAGLVAGSVDRTLRIYQVVFAPTARTAWHVHSGEQVLLALQGQFVVMHHGGRLQRVGEGQTARIPPGTRHWHGALPTSEAIHLAVNLACTTEWLGLVSDQEYAAAIGSLPSTHSR